MKISAHSPQPSSKVAPVAHRRQPGAAVGFETSSRFDTTTLFAQKSVVPSRVRNDGPRGAFYHKVESTPPSTATLGITASVTLGRFVSDPSRPPVYSSEGPEGRAQDVMSNYMGTSATATIKGVAVAAESDAGFATARNFDAQGRPTFVPAAQQAAGTRPPATYYESGGKFFNSTTNEVYAGTDLVPHFCNRAFARVKEAILDANGKPVVVKGEVQYTNVYKMLPKSDQSQYAYQGETVAMQVQRTPPPAKGDNVSFSFTVQRADGSKTSGALAWRSETLAQPSALVQVKRITSIDQRGGEENGTVPTLATVTNAVWNSATVISRVDGKEKKDALAGANAEVVHGRDSKPATTFSTSGMTSAGGQVISIDPPNPPVKPR
jgi:hypothetical protein